MAISSFESFKHRMPREKQVFLGISNLWADTLVVWPVTLEYQDRG